MKNELLLLIPFAAPMGREQTNFPGVQWGNWKGWAFGNAKASWGKWWVNIDSLIYL